MLCSASIAAIAALLFASNGGVGGVLLSLPNADWSESGSFRAISVPYHAVTAPREDVSRLPASLANGNLLAYEPRRPATDDLLLFLPGSTQPCEVYSQLLEALAGRMYTLCLPYDNRKAIAMLCLLDKRCYPEIRMEAYNGSFGHVPGNNIELRLASALAYLVRTDGGAWSRYLDAASGLPLWGRVRASGHSQGAGASAYIGYLRELPRVVQLSGVCDRSDWTRKLGAPATPASRFFGLASKYDTLICPPELQVTSWRAEGALPGSSWPVELDIGDNLTVTSLGHSHTVISSILPPGCGNALSRECRMKAHDSTALDVWTSRSPYANGLWQALFGV